MIKPSLTLNLMTGKMGTEAIHNHCPVTKVAVPAVIIIKGRSCA